ncbi:protein kinase domain-containing protein, partial [Archangium sp.]|uniref:serine/threonine-protein kinase n=1 Tax=Archangium sp. TaxID=1872627 RepID=UPI00389B086E
MSQQHAEELRMALAEGILHTQEVEALREEALRLERSPLELLVERGRLSPESLASLRRAPPGEALPAPGEPEDLPTPTASPPQRGRGSETPAFPVAGWDRYRCVRFLGQGGMGRVFLAYDPRLRRNVALKFVREDDPELTRRFISEARAQARVDHERVCKVYEVGEVQGRAYIAMQYVDGQPLNLLGKQLTLEQKVMVLREAAEGLHEAHRAGLIHRDVKPSNILVARTEDGRLEPYVMDFGLARDWKEGVTVTGTVVGTPHYMAPEQARGEVGMLDRRADVYGLGATLYHLLVGQPPIPGGNGLEVLNNIATVEPRPPRALEAELPADLEAITLKCLEKDRSARYDSARALAEDLDRFLGGEPVLARPAGPWYRLRKQLRKHRLLVTLGAAALTLVLLALGQAGLARREVTWRERLAREFTEQVEHLEAQARYSALSPAHDTRDDRKRLRASMDELDARIRQAGESAVGPGNYALGRGFLALGDEGKAREYLERAWRYGFQEPRVAYALALVMGHLYQQRLLEAERLRSPEQREARKRDLERDYRDPALGYLRRSEGSAVPSTEYMAALLAFYEGRFDEALARLDSLGNRLPWFHEAPKLRGDILLARATQYANQGQREQALADFEAGRQAYARAAAIAESVPDVHYALAELEFAVVLMELYAQGDVLPPVERGLAAVARALAVAPDHYDSKLLEARFHRRLAEHHSRQGKDVQELLQKALASARAALALEPSRQEARLELGRIFWQWGQNRQDRNQDPREQLREAAAAFESLAPEARDYDFHLNLGLVFKVWAEYEGQSGVDPQPHQGQAIASFRQALQLDERQLPAWLNLGSTYFLRASHPSNPAPDEDLERARAALDKAQALNPQHFVPYFYAGQVDEQMASRSRARGGDARPMLIRALEQYREGIAISPATPHLHNGVGQVLLQQAQEEWDRGGKPFPLLDQALAAFNQTLTMGPQLVFAINNLGEVHARRASYLRALGEEPGPSVRKAAELFRRAIEQAPTHPTPRANLGMVHHTQAAFELEHGRDPQRSLAQASEAL